jgi:hypothetical protein
MQTGVMRFLLIVVGVRCLGGCSLPEANAAPSEKTASQAGQGEGEQRALDRRRLQMQKQVMSELQKLHEERVGASGATEPASLAAAKPAEYRLLVFGGPSHEVYLGCLCKERNAESVFNLTGEYGSDLSQSSLRNKFAPYGSNYEDTSACNPHATHPPSVVASDGKSLGLLTLNPSLKRGIALPAVTAWLARMCRL